jgi:hypothetical protein
MKTSALFTDVYEPIAHACASNTWNQLAVGCLKTVSTSLLLQAQVCGRGGSSPINLQQKAQSKDRGFWLWYSLTSAFPWNYCPGGVYMRDLVLGGLCFSLGLSGLACGSTFDCRIFGPPLPPRCDLREELGDFSVLVTLSVEPGVLPPSEPAVVSAEGSYLLTIYTAGPNRTGLLSYDLGATAFSTGTVATGLGRASLEGIDFVTASCGGANCSQIMGTGLLSREVVLGNPIDIFLLAAGTSYLFPGGERGAGGGSVGISLQLFEIADNEPVRILYAPPLNAVPEPSAMLLMAGGLMLVILQRFLPCWPQARAPSSIVTWS